MPANFPDNPTVGQSFSIDNRSWIWNGSTWDADLAPAAITFEISPTEPQTVLPGSGWFDTSVGKFFMYYDNAWVEFGTNLTGPQGEDGYVGADGAPGRFITSETAPPSPLAGDAWFDPNAGQMFVYYDSSWIEVAPSITGPAGASGTPGRFLVSETEPVGAVEGDAWFDATSSRTYIYFDNLWVEVIGAMGPEGPSGASADSDQVILAAQIFG
jgi:hypothetical protein